jgi:predicted HAD superfamily Cof-like phosphohydrolase
MIDPITDPRGAVAEFMRAAGQECPDQPVRLSPQLQELRRSLILEEIREFQQAADLYEKYGTNDALVAVADALADIAYVTIGAMVAWGFTPADPLYSQSRPNLMTDDDRMDVELLIQKYFRKYLRDAKALCDRIAEDKERGDFSIASWHRGAFAPLSPFSVLRGLRLMIGALRVASEFYAIPLAGVFAEVHRSNMTKFVQCLQLDADCPACRGTGYASVRRDDGKILKPPSFEPPNIAAVLRKHGRIA